MKIGVVAAGGRLGGKIVTEALNRGHQVTAIIHHSPCRDPRAKVLARGLFELTPEDTAEFDVLLSAYGSGFDCDPVINRRAMNQLGTLVQGTELRLIAIAGAGVLYTDESRSVRVYELPSHPAFLRGISENTALGTEDVMAMERVHWTFVSPGVVFDGEGPRTGDYMTAPGGCVLYNEDGSSYTSYDDLAAAMLDMAEQGSYDRQMVTVVSRRGTPG